MTIGFKRVGLRMMLAAGTAPLAFGLAGPVFAQGSGPSPAITPNGGTPAASAPAGLAEIVVTAQRRSENLQKAGVAVAVISPTQLLNAGVVTSSSLNAAVPALDVAQAGGANTSYFLRGVGNFTVNAYADPAVAFNYDGVYVGRPTSTTFAFYDLERIEVLKGPQGILYGRNATGGAINVLPAKPILNEFGGYITADVGNFSSKGVEGAINLPISDTAAVRVSGKVIDDGGYNDDGTSDQKGDAARLQLLYKPTSDLSIRLAADYEHQGGVGPGASFNGELHYAPGAPATGGDIANYRYVAAPSTLGPFSGLHTPAAEAYFSSLSIDTSFINPAPSLYPSLNNDYWGLNAEIAWKTSLGTLTWIPAYRDSHIDAVFNGPGFYAGLNKEHDRQFSSELRFAANPIGPLDLLGGFYYFKEDIDADYTFDQYQINVYQSLSTGTQSFAGFARAVYHVTDRLRLVGGARYTDDNKHFNLHTGDTLVEICANAPPPFGSGCYGGPSVPPLTSLSAFPYQPAPIPNGPPVPFGTAGNLLVDSRLVQNSAKSFDRLTYRGAVEYDLAPRSLLYVSYETGFRSGGFSASQTYPTYNPEFIKATTIGLKNRFFDNSLQLNVEGFYWDYTNQQVTHFGVEADGSANLFTQNLGSSTIKGVDLDGQWLAAHDTLIRGSVQYLDNTIDSFSYTQPYGGFNNPPVTGCAVSSPANAAAAQVYTINCAGKSGYNSPKWSVNLGGDQTFRFSDYAVVLSADLRYRSNRVLGFEQLPQQMSGADTILDLNARFGPRSDQWSLSVFVRNVTNTAEATAAQYSGSSGDTITTNYAPPRTYGARLTARF